MKQDEVTPHLKEIAGRIAQLSYREMNTFAATLTIGMKSGADRQEIVDALLLFSDNVLNLPLSGKASDKPLKRNGCSSSVFHDHDGVGNYRG